MKLIVIGITFLLCSPALSALPQNSVETGQILTNYNKAKELTAKTLRRRDAEQVSGKRLRTLMVVMIFL